MKSGTAQKLILNMITTTLMIQLGRVAGNRMVNMQLTNQKLIERGTRMIMEELGYSETKARRLLLLHGSVKNVLDTAGEKNRINFIPEKILISLFKVRMNKELTVCSTKY